MYENITNHYSPVMERPHLKTQQAVVFEPREGLSFAHIPHITHFKGRFYIMWASGEIHEDDLGQVIRYSSSEDFFTWSEPKILAGPWQGENRLEVCSPNGWYNNGEQLIAYFMHFGVDDGHVKGAHRTRGPVQHTNWGYNYMVSTDGENWEGPFERNTCGEGNHGPRRLKNGRLFVAGCTEHCYSDVPDGIHGWVPVKGYPNGYPKPEHAGEDVLGKLPGALSDTKPHLNEAAFVERDDGTIYVFYRSSTPYLWACESHDHGESFTLPQPTRFTDNRTKFMLGRLPDGRYYYIGTPDPFPSRTRHVLALSLSDDGLDYTRHYLLDDTAYKCGYIGMDKNGVYGYPTSIVHDGYLYVTCSICKERIICMRTPIDAL